jgi:hypothetical protein
MTTTNLRSFLEAHEIGCFDFRGEVVDVQRLVDHYATYLDVQIATDGESAFFITRDGIKLQPFTHIAREC